MGKLTWRQSTQPDATCSASVGNLSSWFLATMNRWHITSRKQPTTKVRFLLIELCEAAGQVCVQNKWASWRGDSQPSQMQHVPLQWEIWARDSSQLKSLTYHIKIATYHEGAISSHRVMWMIIKFRRLFALFHIYSLPIMKKDNIPPHKGLPKRNWKRLLSLQFRPKFIHFSVHLVVEWQDFTQFLLDKS